MQSSRVADAGRSRPADPHRAARRWRAARPALARLGITTPREALWYLPFRYDDFSELRPLRRARA